MAYWLLKSEPDAFSWEQQVAAGIEPWTGVRSHQAKRNLMAMREGEKAFFYHSNSGREIVGIVRVVREAYPDPTADVEGWVCVDVEAVEPLGSAVTLMELKRRPEFVDLALIRQSRLSVVPVSDAHWAAICRMGAGAG